MSLDGDITVRSVSTQGPVLRFSGTPRVLFSTTMMEVPDYAVSPDGQHFAVFALNPDAPAREIPVVLNWFEELKEKAGR